MANLMNPSTSVGAVLMIDRTTAAEMRLLSILDKGRWEMRPREKTNEPTPISICRIAVRKCTVNPKIQVRKVKVSFNQFERGFERTRDVPHSSVLPKLLGNTGKSTARMARHVIAIIWAR